MQEQHDRNLEELKERNLEELKRVLNTQGRAIPRPNSSGKSHEPEQPPAGVTAVRLVTQQKWPKGMNYKYVRPKLLTELDAEVVAYIHGGGPYRVCYDGNMVKTEVTDEPGVEAWELGCLIERLEE